MQSAMPTKAFFLKGKSFWTQGCSMNAVLQSLRNAVEHWSTTREISVAADTCKCHISPKVWPCASSQKWIIAAVVAHLTWGRCSRATPLSTRCKQKLGNLFHQTAFSLEYGKLTAPMVAEMVVPVVRDVLEASSWTKALQDSGLTGPQQFLSERTCRNFSFEVKPKSAATFHLSKIRDHFSTSGTITLMDDFFPCIAHRVRGRQARRQRRSRPMAICLAQSCSKARLAHSSSALPATASS